MKKDPLANAWHEVRGVTSGELKKAQAKVDATSARILELRKVKEDYESRQVMEAFRKSGKSLQELMTFLDV